jgi:hypothetical protein
MSEGQSVEFKARKRKPSESSSEIDQAILKLREYLTHPHDPGLVLSIKKTGAEDQNKAKDEFLARMKARGIVLIGDVNVMAGDYHDEDHLREQPAYKNKFRGRWFEMVFDYIDQLAKLSGAGELTAQLEDIKIALRDHNSRFEEIKKMYATGEDATKHQDYQKYLSERNKLIARTETLARRAMRASRRPN